MPTIILMTILTTALILVLLFGLSRLVGPIPLADVKPNRCPNCNALLGVYGRNIYYIDKQITSCPSCRTPLRLDERGGIEIEQ